ncbi:MAG: GH92 family glycosyl hydrolase [Bacteroidales bacterium]|jgi:predicted alpha-1,2-mannosidase|nr:GH92 family glycosyl hydrolase [Bacteroidales bacterium]
MRKQLLPLTLLLLSITTLSAQKTILVNPFVGTDAHGHTYPGAVAPFGQVQLSPDTRLSGWDGCSGYHWTDTVCFGFSHTHLSGTGCADLCDILFVPTCSIDISANHSSVFSKQNEKAEAGYYTTLLENDSIAVQLTATTRCGWHSYAYPLNKDRSIIIYFNHKDSLLDCSYTQIDEKTIVGMRRSKAWSENQVVYFASTFSQPIKRIKYDKRLKRLLLSFGKVRKNSVPIEACVALSSVNEKGALQNLKKEKAKSFSDAAKEAKDLWNAQLDKIKIEGGSFQNRVKFYTALYHCSISPNLYSDVSGQYLGMDEKVHKTGGYDRYNVFSLWDTYRTLHPLLAIIDTKRSKDFANTFIDIFKQTGRLPMWEFGSTETYCMIGEHGLSVLCDLYMKGIRANDKLTLEAITTTINPEQRRTTFNKMGIKDYRFFGLDLFDSLGFIPSENEHESVSKTLEYSYNAYCVAQVAQAMGRNDLYQSYLSKAQSYKNLFNPQSGFIEPKNNNRFSPMFNPTEINSHYTEGNAWHYTFYVPQDVSTLIQLMGGERKFLNKLNECFTTSSQTSGRTQADVTGMIGQYCHGNEPSHHTPYLYCYAGEAYRTQQIVRLIMDSLYSYNPDGLCGNDDAGQMSAWFVMSALGFYPVNPVSNEYVIGSPLFDKAVINLENGKTFTINATGAEHKQYVKSLTLNGKPYNKSYITYDQIMAGGTLTFEMSNEPNKSFGAVLSDRPHSKITSNLIVPVPYLSYDGASSFSDELNVSIKPLNSRDKAVVVVKQNDGIATQTDNYKDSEVKLLFDNSAEVSSASVNEKGVMSKVVTSRFVKLPQGRSVKVLSHYDNQYSAGGDFALIDEQEGSDNWRLGSWQGYQGEDLVCIVDLGKTVSVKRVGARFIQDGGAWIFMPVSVRYSFSTDGENFTAAEQIANPIDEKAAGKVINVFNTTTEAQCRYIKVEAINRKTNPDWHISAGEPSWIFIDEIEIEQQ